MEAYHFKIDTYATSVYLDLFTKPRAVLVYLFSFVVEINTSDIDKPRMSPLHSYAWPI